MKRTLLFFFTFALSLPALGQEVTPTRLVSESIEFSDDLDFENLNLAIERQLNSFQTRGGLKGTIKFGNTVYPKSVLRDSLVLLRDISIKYKTCVSYREKVPCGSQLAHEINDRFSIYAPVPRKNEPGRKSELTTHFTSYYSPDLSGSRVPTERFTNPVYKLPEGKDSRYSRVQIDFDKILAGKGLELFWVENSFFDLYLFHVQGGGRITIHNEDGTDDISYLSMTGHNGQKCEFIGRYLSRTGQLPPEQAGRIPNQRKFLEQNPDKQREAFSVCPSYVYFRESDQEPVGRDLISLTVNRSLAIDSTIYKTTGLITFVKTQKATQTLDDGSVRKESFSRFFLAQDTGSKIRGAARCDLYMGYGPVAEMIAYSMDDMGEQYFLIKK
jgi:membrane-bound lytic murein transglycosylase A